MQKDFLSDFLDNAVRARILRVLIHNESVVWQADSLAKRVKSSSANVAKEMKLLEKMDLIARCKPESNDKKTKVGLKESWVLNHDFKHIRALSLFIREINPMHTDQVLSALKSSGRLSTVILSGSFMGDITRPVDIIIVADVINERKLENAVRGLEPHFGRELRYAAFTSPEFRYRMTIQDRLIRDTLDFPHVVLLDKSNVF